MTVQASDSIREIQSARVLQLGIDGGGSGSRFVLYNPEAGAHYEFSGPALQAKQHKPKELSRRIKKALRPILPSEYWTRLRHVTIGLAGGSSGRDAIIPHIKRHFPQARIALFSDAEACFAAHFAGRESSNAALLMCGTGSVLVYEEYARLHYLGGYGPDVFEPCAGRQIGRDFLSLLTRMHDTGAVPPSFEAHGCAPSGRAALLDLIYNTPGSPACFAPVCAALAEEGDSGCCSLMDNHFSAAARLVEPFAERRPQSPAIGLYGGLMKSPYIREKLKNHLQKSFNDAYIFYASADVARFLSEQAQTGSSLIA